MSRQYPAPSVDDHRLLLDHDDVDSIAGNEPCFAAEEFACLRPASWKFRTTRGCTPHIATLVRRTMR